MKIYTDNIHTLSIESKRERGKTTLTITCPDKEKLSQIESEIFLLVTKNCAKAIKKEAKQ
jgi:hypothetical protein